MTRPPIHRRLAAWIALLAMLMVSLAPAISQALGAGGGAGWTEICTAQGAKWVRTGALDGALPDASAATPADDGAPAGAGHLLEHCPYCSIHTPALGLPPATAALLPPTALSDAPPPAFLAAPRTLHAWAKAQPRAPPARS